MRFLITLLLSLFLLQLFSPKINALSCAPIDPLQAKQDYDAVFIGKVISSNSITKNTKLEVVESWKGADSKQVKIYEDNDWGNTYNKGEKILVFANKSLGGWKVPLCAPIQRNVDESDEKWTVYGEPLPLKPSAGLPLYMFAIIVSLFFLAIYYFNRRKKSGNK